MNVAREFKIGDRVKLNAEGFKAWRYVGVGVITDDLDDGLYTAEFPGTSQLAVHPEHIELVADAVPIGEFRKGDRVRRTNGSIENFRGGHPPQKEGTVLGTNCRGKIRVMFDGNRCESLVGAISLELVGAPGCTQPPCDLAISPSLDVGRPGRPRKQEV